MFRHVLVSIVGLSVLAAVLIPPARAGTVVFEDDFSTNPLTSGKWTDLRREYGDPDSELVWNAADESFDLAKGTPWPGGSGGYAEASIATPDSGWTAAFDYRAPDDGIGGTLGCYFNGKLETPDERRPVVLGYYLVIDNAQNAGDPVEGYVGLLRRSTIPEPHELADLLAWVADDRTSGDSWHHVEISVDEGNVRVYLDDMLHPILEHSITGFDDSWQGLGFFAATRETDFAIDNVVVTRAVPLPSSSGLTALGLLGVFLMARRRLRKRAS
jgi:hypothetical protein